MKILENKHVQKIVIIFIICLFLEAIVFNVKSFRLIFGKYEEKHYTVNRAEGLIYNSKGLWQATGNNASIEILNIDTKIGTIKIDVNQINEDKYKISEGTRTTVSVGYTDKTSSNYSFLPKIDTVSTVEGTKYITCFLSGETEKIKVDIETQYGQEYIINEISVNEQVPYNFNITRFLIIFLISVFIYGIMKLEIFNKIYNGKNKIHSIIIMNVTLIFIALLVIVSSSVSNSKITNEETENIYNQVLVNQLLKGQVNLKEGLAENLEILTNPYDITQRENMNYLWDTAYYNGNYYVYFGILPAILLFIPYKLITRNLFNIINWNINIFNIRSNIFSKDFFNNYKKMV